MLQSIPGSAKWLIIFSFLIAGCKPKETVAGQQTVYHLVVSFYSIGAGINAPAHTALKNLITEFTEERKLPVHVEKKPWGREGEVDYCIDLKDLTQKDRQEFINKAKQYLGSEKWVRIKENTACRSDNP